MNLASLLESLAPRVGAPPWPTRTLGPAPAIRQVAAPPEPVALRPVTPRELAAARALLRDRREDVSVDPEPIDVEVLGGLDASEAFALRQLFAVRPHLARGSEDGWDRIDRWLLQRRGLEAASVVSARSRSALWVRDAALVPVMVERTLDHLERGPAWAFLSRHADLAAAWAVRAALGSGERDRDRGAALLSWLASSGREDVLDQALGRLPLATAREDLAPVLATPHVEGVPCRLPRRFPGPLGEDALPPLVTNAGDVLARELAALAIRALAEGAVIGASAVEAAMKEELTPASLDALGTALIDAWMVERAPSTTWVFDVAARLGGEPTVRALVAARRTLARKKDPHELRALDALALATDDLAVFELGRLTEVERHGPRRTRAWTALRRVARERGTTPERLIETTLPSLGLDPRGERTIDGVILEVGPALRVSVRGEGSKAAVRAASELEADVRAVAARAARRLERAMCDARPIALDTVLRMQAHPIVRRVVEALIWQDESRAAFRFAEDGSTATIEDDPRPAPQGSVRVAHPSGLAADARARWASLLASYELLQPFPQLARPVHALGPTTTFDAAIPAVRVHALVGRGFRLDWAGDELVKTLPSGHTLRLRLSPPFEPRADPREQGTLSLRTEVEDARGSSVAASALEAAVVSELLELLGR